MEKKTPYAPDNQTRLPLGHYGRLYRQADPAEIAQRCGIAFDGGFTLTVLGREKRVSWPEFRDAGWTDKERILFLRYLLQGEKIPAGGTFLTYREMPWGEVYDANFRGRCLSRLARTYGARPGDFERACLALGGRRIDSSGAAYELAFLPGLFLRFILWEGEEDIPAAGQILFSDNFPAAFAAEDRVIVCEVALSALRESEKAAQ